MFTHDYRDEVLRRLLAQAEAEAEITAAAPLGSGARGTTDEWSDVDLALRLSSDADVEDAVQRWSTFLYDRWDVAHHLDVRTGRALYRVFLLPNSLQVDMSFWTSESFASNGEAFQLLFGDTNAAMAPGPPSADYYIGMGWLHALHARSAIARRLPWQGDVHAQRDEGSGDGARLPAL